MNKNEPFLRAIAERPDDDVPRLVYADWLDENGGRDAAEYIRMENAMQHLTEKNREEYMQLTKKMNALFDQVILYWNKELGLREKDGSIDSIQHGIPSGVILHNQKTYRSTLQRLCGVVKEVSLEGSNGDMASFLNTPELGSVERLSLSGMTLSRRARHIAHTPYLGNVKSLNLEHAWLTDGAANEIARGNNMPKLETLNMANNHLTYYGAFRFMPPALFPALKRLDLRRNNIEGYRIREIQSLAIQRRLRVLLYPYDSFGLRA